MPLRFATLRPGQKPVEVPPPGGALMTPATNELPGLAQVVGDNLHWQGTEKRPGFTAQLPTLDSDVDLNDLAAVGSVGNPTQLGVMATRADVRTQVMDTLPQLRERREQMSTNRLPQQFGADLQGAQSMLGLVAEPQRVQQELGQRRLMTQQMAQAGGRDATSDFANAQAMEFSALYRQRKMSQLALKDLDAVTARIESGGSIFDIGG